MQADIDVNLEQIYEFLQTFQMELLKLATVSKNYVRQWFARVTNRIFGWYLPLSFMCCTIDMANHSHQSACSLFIVSKDLHQNPQKMPSYYNALK